MLALRKYILIQNLLGDCYGIARPVAYAVVHFIQLRKKHFSTLLQHLGLLVGYIVRPIEKCFCTVITFYSSSCLGQETAKEPFGLQVKLPPVYPTRERLHTVPLIAERQAAKL